MKTALILLAVLALTAPLGSEDQNPIYLHVVDSLKGLVWADPSRPCPDGVLVLTKDDSPETTHFYVYVEYVIDGQTYWDSRIVQKSPAGLSPIAFETRKPVEGVTRASAVAMKVTGYRWIDNTK